MRGIAIYGGEVYIGAVETQAQNYSFIQSNQLATCEEINFVGFEGLVRGVAADGSHVYWAVANEETIGRIPPGDIEGGGCKALPNCETEFVKPGGGPFGLALDGERLYWSSNGEGGANPGNDLYRYDTGTGGLTDLAPDPDPGDVNGAEVQGISAPQKTAPTSISSPTQTWRKVRARETATGIGLKPSKAPATSTSSTKARSRSSPRWLLATVMGGTGDSKRTQRGAGTSQRSHA